MIKYLLKQSWKATSYPLKWVILPCALRWQTDFEVPKACRKLILNFFKGLVPKRKRTSMGTNERKKKLVITWLYITIPPCTPHNFMLPAANYPNTNSRDLLITGKEGTRLCLSVGSQHALWTAYEVWTFWTLVHQTCQSHTQSRKQKPVQTLQVLKQDINKNCRWVAQWGWGAWPKQGEHFSEVYTHRQGEHF